MKKVAVWAILLALPSGVFAQNLLVNGNFEAGGSSPCASGKGWTKSATTNNCLYDGTTHMPSSGEFEGAHHGSTDVGDNPSRKASIYQAVTVTPGLEVRLTGAVAGSSWCPYMHFVQIHDGADDTAPVLVRFETGNTNTWQPFDLRATPTASQVTVSWGFDTGGPGGWVITATHVDALVLTQAQPTCTGEPAITSVSPTYGANNGTLGGVQVTGENFDATCQVILRREGYPDIAATDEAANAEGTMITCNLPITGAAMGKWNLVVTKTNCNEAQLNNAIIVAYPTLTNGSFESPLGFASSCPNPPTPIVAPTDWLQLGVSTGSDHLIRDSDQWPPSCPRPDGDHFASVMVPTATSFGHWRVFQYIAVTPGQTITVSGRFAGGGRSASRLQILEGDDYVDNDAELLASTLIEDRVGCPPHSYDWVPVSVTATPTGGLITVRWLINGHTSVPVAAHADALTLTIGDPPAEVCGNGIDDDGDRRTDCQDPDCATAPGCDPPPVEICDNGIDDDGDVYIDCDDSDCDSVCVEICNNGIDDDHDCDVDLDDSECENCTNGVDDNGDGLVDCDDPTCLGHEACPSEICTDGIDNNGDTLIDCADPGCAQHPHCKANDPFADYDGDGDVDQNDFAALQVCVTGAGGTLDIGCGMFDRDFDLDIDQTDINRFEMCASGPGVPAAPACDN